ncbi:MAG TPA: serine/threonine-protein kinase, partial [Myxococcota bacterium]
MPTRTASETTTEVAIKEANYEEVVSSTSVDRRLLRGPFATHVWGGRYEVERFAGEGSQGATFIGVDRKTGAKVALKLFDLKKAKDWKAQELFDREVATLKRLSHGGIPQFMDVIVDDDTGARCLVMTHVAGDALGAVLKRDGVVAEKRLWSFVVDAAHILSSVHSDGVVHRDLKPDNFILRPDGSLAIVDFGGVGAVRAQAGSTVVGTFGYMAPEQLYGA